MVCSSRKGLSAHSICQCRPACIYRLSSSFDCSTTHSQGVSALLPLKLAPVYLLAVIVRKTQIVVYIISLLPVTIRYGLGLSPLLAHYTISMYCISFRYCVRSVFISLVQSKEICQRSVCFVGGSPFKNCHRYSE